MPRSRRDLLLSGAGLALGAAAALPPAVGPAQAQITTLDLAPMPLPVKLDDTVAAGYRRDVLIRWGDRVTSDAPPWDPLRPSAEAAGAQFGWDARIADIVPMPMGADRVPRAVLAVTHPDVDPAMAFADGRDHPDVAAAMQGASLLNLERRPDGRWIVVDGGFQNRRLTAVTLCRLSGPAADALGGGGAVQGVLGLTGGSATPWGTLLLAEDDPGSWLPRLRGLAPRFGDGTSYGWVLELDPLNPTSVPTKRTGLGRFPHGDVAATLLPDSRAVVYMTDRRALGYLFRFVSSSTASDPEVLDSGTLYVARIEGTTELRWVPLPRDPQALLNPVATAERAGATPFDLPSGLALDPERPRLLLACRGAASRPPGQVDALNPRAPNPDGHVIEILPADGDHGAATATARVLFLAGTPGAYGRGMPLPGAAAYPQHPTTLAIDRRGRAWIGTDRGGLVGASADGLFGCDLDGPGRAVPLPLYGAPRGAAIGGAVPTPDGEGLLAVVRQPGAEPGASYARPGTRWPAFDANLPPRTTLIALARERGGAVGG